MITRRRCKTLVLGLLATASAATLYDVAARAQVTHRIEAALARAGGLHAAAISVDPWGGGVVVSQLAGRTGDVAVSIGRLAFRGASSILPQIVTPAQAADGSATAENVEIDTGTSKIHIPKIEARGTDLTNASLAEIFDGKSSASLTDRIAKFTADAITAPDVTIDTDVKGVAQKFVVKDVELDHVERGRIAEFKSSGSVLTMQFTDAAAPMGAIEATIGASRGTDMDVGLYARVMTQARQAADEPLKPLYASSETDSLTVKAQAFTLKTGKLTSGRVSMRPFLIPPSDLQKMSANGPDGKPTPEQTKKTMMAVADIYESMDFDKLEVRDVTGNFGEQGRRGSFALAGARFGQFANARLSEMAFDGFNLTAPKAMVKFDTFAIRSFDFKNSLDMLKTVPFDHPEAMGAINPRSAIPSLGQITLTGLDVDVADSKHDGNAEGGAKDKFRIANLDIQASNYLLGIPGSLSFVVDHLTGDLPSTRSGTRELAELGYTSFDVSSKFAYAWDGATNTLTMSDLSAKGAGMAALSVKATFGNVSKDIFVGDAAVMQAALLGAAATQADVRFENDGMITKLFDEQAKQAHVTVDQLKQGLIVNARTNIAQLFGDSPQANSIADAVTTFLKDPKSIEIVAKSAKGFGAADLPLIQNPGELLRRLDIQATANQ